MYTAIYFWGKNPVTAQEIIKTGALNICDDLNLDENL